MLPYSSQGCMSRLSAGYGREIGTSASLTPGCSSGPETGRLGWKAGGPSVFSQLAEHLSRARQVSREIPAAPTFRRGGIRLGLKTRLNKMIPTHVVFASRTDPG